MKTVLLFTSFLMLSFTAAAQVVLSGKVSRGDNPIFGASVSVKGTQQGTMTDSQGNYSLSLEKGTYTFVFSYGNKKEITLFLTEDQILNVDLGNVQENLETVFITAVHVDEDDPIAHSNMTHQEIAKRNLGQDIPILLNYMPSVVTTSDAGAGVGYTGMRVRGSNAMNVTINGIPYNDSESQGAFWVNLGDMASSIENLQLQRGVGTSTNGAGAFGSSLNIETQSYQKEAFAHVANSFGSFNTRKHTVEIGTGLLNDHWAFSGRLSKIVSDGYIDRASSDLKSYFLQGVYVDDNTQIKALTFGGKERTYQAWFGIDGETLKNDRTFNPAGMYTDENGTVKFYDNQTDNYQQDHFQLLWNQKYNDFWSSNIALHYTMGEGYYEEYEEDTALEEYGLETFYANGEEISTSDLVDRSWLDNDFYGTVFSINYKKNTVDALFGGGWNKYVGDHFGEVIYTRFAQNNDPFEPFYFNTGYKTDYNFFGKINWNFSKKFMVYGDLQLRGIHYKTEGPLADGSELLVNDRFLFFNPKAGITYNFNSGNQFYFSFARAHREPNRTDYENAEGKKPVAEELNDFELGWRFDRKKFKLNANLYYMRYKNQFVMTGAIDEEGAPIRENSGESYRLGLELNAAFPMSKKIMMQPNVTISKNQNIDFVSNFNGEMRNFGNTEISFSPSIVASNILEYNPLENLQLALLSKFVGEQNMSNIEAEAAVLESYFINNFSINYTWKKALWTKEIVFSGLVNNIFDVEYVSNGYYFSYDVEDPSYPSGFQTVEGAGYYPQAGINFLVGMELRF